VLIVVHRSAFRSRRERRRSPRCVVVYVGRFYVGRLCLGTNSLTAPNRSPLSTMVASASAASSWPAACSWRTA
jgi:hypothetical protein